MAERVRPTVRRKLSEYRRKRDFSRTREPPPTLSRRGKTGETDAETGTLRFVIQKHAARNLHFDLRLELDGVMKSWAVPKGPSLDPSVKRLAMEVEDHPIAYNTFEGTIPRGEYGGGTVMLWDRGTHTTNDRLPGESDSEALRRGYEKGKLDFTLHGERLRGSWALVRTRRGDTSKPQWLLIKHRDRYAQPRSDVVSEHDTSVDTGRSMDEIASGQSRVWRSNRRANGESRGATGARARPAAARPPARTATRSRAKRLPRAEDLRPMLASIGTSVPEGDGWTFEPKYDGIRVLAYVTPKAVKLITRNGKDKSKQFPEVVAALRKLVARSRRPLVLDGEIVALDAGSPARFQELQSRMHVKDAETIAEHSSNTPAAFIAFDILLDGDDVLIHDPWIERRKRLEARLRNRASTELRLGESHKGDGKEMLESAREAGWEGIIAKRIDSPYAPGVRSDAWLKLKVEYRQEFVVGGYTEPRNTREHIGALLLGYFDRDRFLYVGHTGGGFTRAGLKEMRERLNPLARKTSPFEETPKTNERAHWVRPEVVVETKFNEWTADGKLRQPIYLGTRDDKDAREVGHEPVSVQPSDKRGAAPGARVQRATGAGSESSAARESRTGVGKGRAARTAMRPTAKSASIDVVAQLDVIEREGGDGVLRLPRDATLEVSSLDKVFFPDDGYTKGDLMRYYARVAPAVLPAIADRPLVLKRFPNGINGQSFFQQNAPDQVPDGVRVETIRNEAGEAQRRIVGGDLPTLLYTIQLGAISLDPWHCRVQSLEYADYTILDLDPGPRAPFARAVEVAQWVKEELDERGLRAALKTSGSRGVHISVPLPPRTTNDAALLVAQIVATRVAEDHPRAATVERSVKARPPAAVYVDYLQNVRGKSVASVYSIRAKPGATVSTPLEWRELTPRLDPREYTIETVPGRIAKKGDISGQVVKRGNPARTLKELGNL